MSFTPHAQTVPSLFRARLWKPPLTIATTPVSPLTGTGVRRCAVLPSPSWPTTFDPYAQTVPSLFRARLWKLPLTIATTPVSPLTWTGAKRFVVLPSPSWP